MPSDHERPSMDLDLETDVALSAAEVFELNFIEAGDLSQLQQSIKRTMEDVRNRHPLISDLTMGFAIGCAYGRHDLRRRQREPEQ